jgi:dihydropteroate synthase
MTQIMGILNATPDSFSDGGLRLAPVACIAAGRAMLEAGADILDIGGESTRPGATPVPPAEEQRRVLPVIAALARAGACISIDTRNAETMAAALAEGAAIVNDVSALRHDAASAQIVAGNGCRVVLMHMRGTPQTMAKHAVYGDVVAEVRAELEARVAEAEAAGIARSRIVIDPGFGFAKTAEQDIILLQRLAELGALGLPILAGMSRKRFIGRYGGEDKPLRRGPGSLAAALFAHAQGVAILRVHDVAETRQALRLWQALAPVS